MPERSLTEALDDLANAVGRLVQEDPQAVRPMIERWVQARGAGLHGDDCTIDVRLQADDPSLNMRLVVSWLSTSRVHHSAPADTTESEVSSIASALNRGELRREIDAAVGSEPELAV